MENNIKITLIGVYNSKVEFEEVGLSCLAAYMRQQGYHTQLISVCINDLDINSIVQFAPDIVGFTCYYNNMDTIDKVNGELRTLLSSYICVIGGNHATYNTEEVFSKIQNIDVVVRGEGEETLLEIAKHVSEQKAFTQIKGISYVCNDSIVHNETRPHITNLDELPFMARDTLVYHKFPVIKVSTSRGCKGNCFFCTSGKFWNKWRGRSPANIVQEVQQAHKTYGIDIINFIDASFEDPDDYCHRLSEIAQGLIDSETHVYYTFQMRAEMYRKITPDLMNRLVKSGLFRCFIGIEAVNENDLKLYRKKSTLNDCYHILDVVKNYNIGVLIGMISFNPYSTRETILSNISFLQDNNYIHRFYGLRVYPGTDLLQKINHDGLLDPARKFGYKFVNHDVGEITEFVMEYLSTALLKFSLLMYDLSEDINFDAYYFMRKCETLKRLDVIEEIKKYISKNTLLYTRANQIAAQWMREIYTLWSTEWNEAYALKYSEAFFKENEIFDILQVMNTNRYAFHTMLTRKKLK